MRPLGGTVQRVLRALGLERDVARAAALHAWLPAATAVIGTDAGLTRALLVEGDALVVTVPTAQWAVEIRLRERELLRALERGAPGSGIRHIRSVPDERARDSL
jgi:predicted nucleic acid-binding Zn ribbon protein